MIHLILFFSMGGLGSTLNARSVSSYSQLLKNTGGFTSQSVNKIAVQNTILLLYCFHALCCFMFYTFISMPNFLFLRMSLFDAVIKVYSSYLTLLFLEVFYGVLLSVTNNT